MNETVLFPGKMPDDEMALRNLSIIAGDNKHSEACMHTMYLIYRQHNYNPADAYYQTLCKVAGVDPKRKC